MPQVALPPSNASPLHMTPRPRRAALLAGRHSRNAKRDQQFALAVWFLRLLLIGALAAGAYATIAWTAPLPTQEATPAVAVPPADTAVPPAPAINLEGFLAFRVHLSHYDPSLGGTNCFNFVSGECLSGLSNGERWQDNMGTAAACVPEWAFGTVVVLEGGEIFTCKDRGGGIVLAPDGLPWIDLLLHYPPLPYGAITTVRVKFPSG